MQDVRNGSSVLFEVDTVVDHLEHCVLVVVLTVEPDDVSGRYDALVFE